MSQNPLSYLAKGKTLREINVMIPRSKSTDTSSSTAAETTSPPSSRPPSVLPPSHDDDDTIEVEELSDEELDEKQQRQQQRQRFQQPQPDEPADEPADEPERTDSKSPAYVAPIGHIPNIPPIPKMNRRSIPQFIKDHLVGKRIDENGDVIDEKTGKILGRVAGDLPSMVGRPVLNQRGDVLGDDGELLGYVAEVETEDEGTKEVPRGNQKQSPERSPTRSLEDYMSTRPGPGGLRVDLEGNILDADGNVVGSFHDNNTGFGKPAPRSEEEKGTTAGGSSSEEPKQETAGQRPNAQSHRKEDDSPSDIFLDVKSTREGIQLTIRIPTVFPGGGQPKVSFS